MYIFLDESGDMGFDFSSKNPSKMFIITLMICDDDITLGKIKKSVNRTRRKKLGKNKGSSQELKGSKTHISVKEYFLEKMPESGWRLYCVALNKQRVFPELTTTEAKEKFYNFLSNFLLQKLRIPETINSVSLIVDRSKSSKGIQDFNGYISRKIREIIPPKASLYINHESSIDNPALQAVDLFSWGFFRMYERDDSDWYLRYKKYVAYQTIYFRDKKN